MHAQETAQCHYLDALLVNDVESTWHHVKKRHFFVDNACFESIMTLLNAYP